MNDLTIRKFNNDIQRHIRDYLANITNKKTYTMTLRVFRAYFSSDESMPFEHYITASSLIKYRDRLIEEGKSSKTIHTYFGILKSFLRWLYESGAINTYEISRVKLPRLQAKKTKALTLEESKKLKTWKPKGMHQRALRLALNFLILSGARVSAILKMKWKDIEGDHVLLYEKMEKIRTYYLPEKLIRELEEFKSDWESEHDQKLSEGDLVIQYSNKEKVSKPMDSDYFNRRIRSLTGVEEFSSHRPRATVITELLEEESPRNTANFMDINLVTVERYDNKNEKKNKEISKKIAK